MELKEGYWTSQGIKGLSAIKGNCILNFLMRFIQIFITYLAKFWQKRKTY